MSGHSKWSTIKHKKAKTDAQKGKVFTQIIREMTVAAREGGGDPAGNARLRLVIEKARAVNMPQENMIRAIKKGTGELEGVNYESIKYEGYGPAGVAIIIDVLTENKNRAVADLRRVFTRFGAHLGEAGCVSWMFEQKGVVTVNASNLPEDKLLEKMLNYNIDEVSLDDGIGTIYAPIEELESVKKGAEAEELKVESADISWVPKTPIELDDASQEKVIKFLEEVEDLDDVQNVYCNFK